MTAAALVEKNAPLVMSIMLCCVGMLPVGEIGSTAGWPLGLLSGLLLVDSPAQQQAEKKVTSSK